MFFGGRKSSGQNKGHDKVVPMDNFRSHTPVSAMRQAEAYWTALRRGDDIPSRSQIDPRGLENILSQTFILERVAPGIARFRLAGQKVNEMAGMEVRGMPITAFFTPDARKQLSAALEHMFEVALCLRMCCSLVDRVSVYAVLPSVSMLWPTIRPGISLRNSFVQAKMP